DVAAAQREGLVHREVLAGVVGDTDGGRDRVRVAGAVGVAALDAAAREQHEYPDQGRGPHRSRPTTWSRIRSAISRLVARASSTRRPSRNSIRPSLYALPK